MKLNPLFLLICPLLAGSGCGKNEQSTSVSPNHSTPQKSISGSSRVWSKALEHYPGYPIYPQQREWSHHEISQRHRNLVMKALPEYITDLRGGSPMEESPRTSAAWFFNVPEAHRGEFAQYIMGLGVPEHALRESFSKTEAELPVSQWPEKPASPPVVHLLFLQSAKSIGDTVIMGTKFGKSWDSMAYFLTNLNYTRASILITVAWKSGDVQVCEKRAYDD